MDDRTLEERIKFLTQDAKAAANNPILPTAVKAAITDLVMVVNELVNREIARNAKSE